MRETRPYDDLNPVRKKWPPSVVIPLAFRFVALGVAGFQTLIYPHGPYGHIHHDTPMAWYLLALAFYTCAKVAEPAHWQRVRGGAIILFGLDVAVAATMIFPTGEIHSPFLLYTFAPVLTAAFQLSRRATVAVAGVTALLVLANYLDHIFIFQSLVPYPPPSAEEIHSIYNEGFLYLIALFFVVSVPYATRSKQRLQSAAIVEERRRLTRELHDGLCQMLVGLRWQVQLVMKKVSTNGDSLAHLRQLETVIQETERKARDALESMRSFDGRAGLLPQIEAYLDHLRHECGMNCQLQKDSVELDVDDMVEVELANICQEALLNVKKHSGARNLVVSVGATEENLRIRIADDGRGFDTLSRNTKSHGLSIMKERAGSVGGTLQVVSSPGMGTQIKVEVPKRWSPMYLWRTP